MIFHKKMVNGFLSPPPSLSVRLGLKHIPYRNGGYRGYIGDDISISGLCSLVIDILYRFRGSVKYIFNIYLVRNPILPQA